MALPVMAITAPIVGGFMGNERAAADRQAAENARLAALNQYLGINPPSVTSQELNLANYQNAGNLTPQQEQALSQGPSAMEGIQTDPRLQQAQMAALQQLSTVGQLGMSPAQRAALAQSQNQAAAMTQAKNAQIMDQFARTGMGGSGAQLAAQLSASQGGSNQQASNANQIAQNAQQNALQAMVQSGQLGGQMQGQQFGQQAQVASAKDYINRFNTQNSQEVQRANVQAANAAALRNLINQQNIMNQNTGTQNYQQEHNKGLLQQQFNNQMGLASARAGQYQGIAQANQAQAGRTADMYAGIGQGVGQGLAGMYQSQNRPTPTTNNYYGGQQAGGGSFPEEGTYAGSSAPAANQGYSSAANNAANQDSNMYEKEVY